MLPLMHQGRRSTREPDELQRGDHIEVVATIEKIERDGDTIVVHYSGTRSSSRERSASDPPIWARTA